MSLNNRSARSQVYKRLKRGFNQFSAMLDVHLEETLLHEMGVDSAQFDLEEETERGGIYFLPKSQECMDSLDQRSGFRIDFDNTISQSIWDFSDGDIINLAFRSQLYYCKNGSASEAWEDSHWQPRW
jgi:hypothetical protein